ncbi:hypothetical protein, partial [Bacillus sp. SIMBA_005]|uniref:hypothetical protein n=1 Tax=Bacillus sp. SIMBA_005 TaxID=3085754 RepID=UPI003978CF2F
KRVRIRDERIVRFEERHLAILRLEVTVENSDAPVTISCQLLNRQDGGNVYAGTPFLAQKATTGFYPRLAAMSADRALQP